MELPSGFYGLRAGAPPDPGGHRPVPLTDVEYRLLAELAANAGRVVTYEHLLERVWGKNADADVRPILVMMTKLRRKLGDDADNPTYVFTEPRVGYWVPAGEAQADSQETST